MSGRRGGNTGGGRRGGSGGSGSGGPGDLRGPRRGVGGQRGGGSSSQGGAGGFSDGHGGGGSGGGGGRPEIDPEKLVYGRHPVREAMRGPRRVHTVHITESALRDLGGDDALRSVDHVNVVEARRLDSLAGTGDHQGVVAEADRKSIVPIDELLARAPDGKPALVLALDQITDPHNLGAIARVCDAAGATGLLIPEHRSAGVTGAVCKASAGAIEHIAVARCVNLADTLERIKSPTLWVYGASERGLVNYTDVDLAGPAVLVLGAEGPGIRPRVEKTCDQLISVPMAGTVASLNVATVAAILAFEAVRQRAGA